MKKKKEHSQAYLNQMAGKGDREPSYQEFMKARSNPWTAQREIAVVILRAMVAIKRRYPDDQTERLLKRVEMMCITLQELADVEIEPIVLVSYQARMFEDIEAEREELPRAFLRPVEEEKDPDELS